MTRGRLRQFDMDEALDTARDVFWQLGYDGTGLADLLAALHIGSGSFYAAFSSKQALFEEVARRYAEARLAAARRACARPDLRDALHALLADAIEAFVAVPAHPGCFFQRSGMHGTGIGGSIWSAYRARMCALLGKRLDAVEGCAWLPLAVMTLIDGLAAQAAAGMSRRDLLAMAGPMLDGMLERAGIGYGRAA